MGPSKLPSQQERRSESAGEEQGGLTKWVEKPLFGREAMAQTFLTQNYTKRMGLISLLENFCKNSALTS